MPPVDPNIGSAELRLFGIAPDHTTRDGRPLVQVAEVSGSEGLSELFGFRFVVVVHPDIIHKAEEAGGIEHGMLMGDVAFRLGPSGNLRHGMINEVRVRGHRRVGEVSYTQLMVSVVPRAWLLTQRRNSRIFQGLYVDEIVSKVLSESGIRHRWDLRHSYPKRIYCTQYEETDYDFVTRLFAEEGISFYFAWPEDFEGGEAASHKHHKSEAEKNEDAAKKALKMAGSVAKEVQGAAKKTKDDDVAGGAGLLGGAIGMAGGLLKSHHDDEDTAPIVPGTGEAGEAGTGDVLVFTDEAAGYGVSLAEDGGGEELKVFFGGDADMRGSHHTVEEIAQGFRTAPEHAEVRDYDFRKPLLLMKSRVGEELEEEDHKPGLPREIYDHHGQYITQDVDHEAAEMLLQAHRRDAHMGHGRSHCARLSSGHRFWLNSERADDGDATLEDRDYCVVRVHHDYHDPRISDGGTGQDGLIRGIARAIKEAVAAGREVPEEELRSSIAMLKGGGESRAYRNRFDCVAADLTYRPPRPARIKRHVTVTATVMGPEGQEIYLDRHGRVKVQFHWDRQGEFDEHSSCWLRVSQPWAGAGYGFQFFPRCGMEVLVTFLGGDTDRPVVIGSLYNGTHATPEPLPKRMTRSGIRTQTSPNGGGFNELSFEDAKNYERIYMHAQRNLEQMVNYDLDTTVGHDQRFRIGGDQQLGIAGDQRTQVGTAQRLQVGGDQSAFVGGSRTTRVATNKVDLVDGDANLHVGGSSFKTVQTSDIHAVRGPLRVSTTNYTSLFVGAPRSDQTAYATAYIQGAAYVTAKELFLLRIQNEEEPAAIRFECGNSSIEILPDKIVLHADKIEVKGRETVESSSEGARFVMDEDILGEAGKITLATDQQAALVLDGSEGLLTAPTLEIRGASVSFTSPSGPSAGSPESDPEEQEDAPNTKVRFTHLASEDGEAIANTKFRATILDRVEEGTTDGNGIMNVFVPDGAVMMTVMLYVPESYPDIYSSEHGPLRFEIAFAEEMAASSEVRGAHVRLENLGYRPGSGKDHVTDAMAEALREFQRDHHIAESGELDERTANKLSEVYGE